MELYKEAAVSSEVEQFLASEDAKFEKRVNGLCTILFFNGKQDKKIICIQLQLYQEDYKTNGIYFLLLMVLCKSDSVM